MAGVFFMPIHMNLKGIYAKRPALFQLFLLLLLILGGEILSSTLVMLPFWLINGWTANITHYPNMMRFLQLVLATGAFLFPAIAVAWTCSYQPAQYLSVGKMPPLHLLLLTFISMFLFSPTINLIGLLNRKMILPEFLAPIEKWMQAQEASAEQLTQVLLAGNGLSTLLFNLLVIAIAAGITEEFLFRGALQRIIGRWTSNHHIVIWSAAILFSAFHMQFYGFLPRMLLGAYFGYLLYWSKNIWIPVFAHFVNNAFAVISLSNAHLKDKEFITGDISKENLVPMIILAAFTLFFFFLCVKRLKKTWPA